MQSSNIKLNLTTNLEVHSIEPNNIIYPNDSQHYTKICNLDMSHHEDTGELNVSPGHHDREDAVPHLVTDVLDQVLPMSDTSAPNVTPFTDDDAPNANNVDVSKNNKKKAPEIPPGKYFIIMARSCRDKVIIKLLEKHGLNLVNVKNNNNGNTALVTAIKNYINCSKTCYVKIIKILLKYGADFTIKNDNGETALSIVEKSKLKDIYELFMSHSNNVNH